MSLKEQISNDMKTALLGGNRFEGGVLRDLRASILNEEVNSGQREAGLADDVVLKVIAREIKRRQESIALFSQNDRQDLVEAEQSEMDVLVKYMPEQLSKSEIEKIVLEFIEKESIELSPKSMGQIIGFVKKQYGAQVDGALLAQVVKEQLTK